jgi:hypothetical protein
MGNGGLCEKEEMKREEGREREMGWRYVVLWGLELVLSEDRGDCVRIAIFT